MIIKKYLADTEAEAVNTAKKELGQGIVIMNVRNVKRKGLMRFFKNPLKEVTVALEEESERFSSAVRDIARVVKENEEENEQKALAKENIESIPKKDETKSYIRNDTADSHSQDQSQNVLQNNAEAEAIVDMEARLESIRNLLQETIGMNEEPQEQTEEPSESENFMKLLYNTMIENEVHEHYANMIIDDLDKNRKNNTPIDYLLANVYQKMVLKFGKPSVITPAKNGAKIVFFIGPTGVGKTTTIAKLASRFCVEEKKRVVLLTTDTYRIAAAEQLRTYANILDVPFRVIYSVEEIVTAWNDFKDYDYILVDTAGHSHQNEEQKQMMKDYLDAISDEQGKEVYLVLSATTKYRDLVNIADTYAEMADYKLIFTKLDETMTLGNLFNLRMHTGAEMSYITCGQNVPNDIAEFNPQSTVRQLLGGRKK